MDKEKKKKKYELLSDRLIDFIKANNLKQNDKLPTVRELISKWQFSYATVHRTLIEMENRGLITTHQGKGVYVGRLEAMHPQKQVALIIPSHFSRFKIFIDVLAGVRAALESKKISLLISISNMSHEEEKVTIERLMTKQVEGMIIFLEDHYMDDYSHIRKLKEANFPFVLIDRYIPDIDTDYVVVNNRIAMHRICAYLKYNRYCDKVVFIPDDDAPSNISSSEEKLVGFREAIDILYGENNATVLTLDELISQIGQLSASYKNVGVSMNHDGMIPIFQDRLRAQNMNVPENCHLFGYNNSFETPIRPTVEQFNEKVGARAAEILVAKMENRDEKCIHARVEPKLVIPDRAGNFHMES